MNLGDGLKKIFLAGVGAAAATTEAARDLIDDLVEKGDITVEQGKILNEELCRNAKKKMKEHVTVQVTKSFEDAYASVDQMSAEELQKLKAYIEETQAKKQSETDKEDPSEKTK